MNDGAHKGSQGLIYVAFGYEYLLMAVHSAFTAKQHNPGITCTVVTDLRIGDKRWLDAYFDCVHVVDMRHEQNRDIKTRCIEFADFERGAYIDCDTEICGDLGPMFECLKRFDVILKLNPRPTNKDYYVGEGVPGYLFPFYNGGLVFFRNNERVSRFFAAWRRLFYEYGKKSDQPALARAVFENPDVRYLTVGSVWNTFPDDVPLLRHKGFSVPYRVWHYIDPADFPDVAHRVFAHSAKIAPVVCGVTADQDAEIKMVIRKYRVLTAWYYRFLFPRMFFSSGLKLCHAIGLLESLQLSRRRYREGNAFGKVPNPEEGQQGGGNVRFLQRLFVHFRGEVRRLLIRLPYGGSHLAKFVVRDDLRKAEDQTYFDVSPEAIVGVVHAYDLDRSPVWFVQSGMWSSSGQLEDSSIFRLFQDVFSVGVDQFEKSGIYARCLEKVCTDQGFRTNRGVVRTKQAFDDYIREQLSLAMEVSNPSFFTEEAHAIPVAVGGDGALYRCGDGKHRQIFAVLHGLPRIRVRIVNIHEDFCGKSSARFRGNSGWSFVLALIRDVRDRYSEAAEQHGS